MFLTDFMSFIKKNIMFIISFIVFLIVSILIYFFYIKKKIKKKYVLNSEFIEEKETRNADFYFFYTKWCPYCKTATPIIDEFKKQIIDNNNLYNNVYINFIDVDCDKDVALAEKFSIKGYPTIKLVYNGNTIEYDAKPDLDNLNEFFKETLK